MHKNTKKILCSFQQSGISDQLSVRLVVELRRPELAEGSKRGGSAVSSTSQPTVSGLSVCYHNVPQKGIRYKFRKRKNYDK
jgi:hypothetical protein